MTTPALTAADEQALVRALAEAALEQAAPEELAVFDETAEEYFAAPEAVLNPKRRDEEAPSGGGRVRPRPRAPPARRALRGHERGPLPDRCRRRGRPRRGEGDRRRSPQAGAASRGRRRAGEPAH